MRLNNDIIEAARIQAERDAENRLAAHYMWKNLCGGDRTCRSDWVTPHYFGLYVVLETPREFVVVKTEDYQNMVDVAVSGRMQGQERGDCIETFKWVIGMLRCSRPDRVLFRQPKPDAIVDGEPVGDVRSLMPVLPTVTSVDWERMIQLLRPVIKISEG